MRIKLLTLMMMTAAAAPLASAGDLGIHVVLQGDVAPGVYGQVRLGNGGPPPVVYERPTVIVHEAGPMEPVYLHVPPDHARHWRHHCHEYNACNRPVYFVRSEEYQRGYHHHD